jgi:hypothetical protein
MKWLERECGARLQERVTRGKIGAEAGARMKQ